MSREAAEWVWKWWPIVRGLPPKKFEQFLLIMRLLGEDLITPEEAALLTL